MNEDGTTNDAEWIIKKNGLFADAYEERIRRKCEEGDIEGITEDVDITYTQSNQAIQLAQEAINIRDYSTNKHNRVDDYPYGGGAGMVMQPMPVYDAWKDLTERIGKKPRVLFMTPQGKPFSQKLAEEYAKEEDLIFLCGHYEGIDQRFIDECVDEEISMGDFVLTGGEIPAMALTAAVCRLVPGVLSDAECFTDESHWDGLLEYPQYSRPEVWHDRHVPPILLSGHHANIAKWRRKHLMKISL